MDSIAVFLCCFALCALVQDVSSNMAWINTTIRSHFSQNRHHVTNPQNKAAAMAYIKAYMADTLKLTVYFDVFPTEASNVYGRNVIGVLKGLNFGTADDILYGIGAHYDTTRNTAGVDDNGSGVTIMLDAATSLAKNKDRKYTCFFVAFDFDEWEYRSQVSNVECDETTGIGRGSKHFVYDWIPNFIANHLSAAPKFGGIYVMDTMMNFNDTDGVQTLPDGFNVPFPKQYQSIKSDGFEGDFVAAIGRRVDHTLLNLFKSSWLSDVFPAAEVEGLSLPITGIPTIQDENLFEDFFRSDHVHFWRNNMSAIFLTDTADLRGYMIKCYHNPCDNVSHLTHDRLLFMSKTSDTLFKALDGLTRRPPILVSTAADLKADDVTLVMYTIATLFLSLRTL